MPWPGPHKWPWFTGIGDRHAPPLPAVGRAPLHLAAPDTSRLVSPLVRLVRTGLILTSLHHLTSPHRPLHTIDGTVRNVVPHLPLEGRTNPFRVNVPGPGGPADDSQQLGCLSHAAHNWPTGTWAGRVARRGLSWIRAEGHAPPLHLPPPFSRKSPLVSPILEDIGASSRTSGPSHIPRSGNPSCRRRVSTPWTSTEVPDTFLTI